MPTILPGYHFALSHFAITRSPTLNTGAASEPLPVLATTGSSGGIASAASGAGGVTGGGGGVGGGVGGGGCCASPSAFAFATFSAMMSAADLSESLGSGAATGAASFFSSVLFDLPHA